MAREFSSIEEVRREMWRRRKVRYKPNNIIRFDRLPGSIRNVTDSELLALLEVNSQAAVGKMFGVRQTAISERLKRRGLNQFAGRKAEHIKQARAAE